MSQLEYLIALISIIVGLGLTDLASSLRELVRPSRPVRWHWLPLLWTANVFLMVMQLWWTSFSTLQEEIFSHALAFLPFLLFFVGLYLACAFALPDLGWRAPRGTSSADEALDLEAFYFSAAHRRGFFGTLVGLILIGQAITVPLSILEGKADPGPLALMLGQNLGIAVLLGSLIKTDRRWAHAGIAVVMFGVLTYSLAASVSPIG